jgi:cytochrome c oxidase assembly protein subunit 15
MKYIQENKGSFFKFVSPTAVPNAVKAWLIVGLVMVFFQIVIGGITRLTGSGLSITKWEIVTGALPPMNEAKWESEFDLYKATPQYLKINQGMALSEFKFIYFWEYFHRLWARTMAVVFIIGFFFFLFRGIFSREMVRRTGFVVLLAAIEGCLGWIMVASGLKQRPWVNAYNLTLHLGMGFTIFAVLFWTMLRAVQPKVAFFSNHRLRQYTGALIAVIAVQIILGALMSGMKAGLAYPTWPMMGNEWIPSVLFDSTHWHLDTLVAYDVKDFTPALVQVLHRSTAYIASGMVLYLFIRLRNTGKVSKSIQFFNILLISLLITQVLLGIFTLIGCLGHIPVVLGVLHQGCAILLLSALLVVYYQMKPQYMD